MGDIEAPPPTVAGEINEIPEPELKGALKPVPEYTPIELAAGGLGAIAIATSLVSIITSPFATLVLIGGLLSSGMGVYAFQQQTQLTDIRTLKETSARVKEEVQRLESENRRLKTSVTELGNTVDELQDVEKALDAITKTQGKSVAALEEQLEENKKILGMMNQNMKGAIIQNLTSVIFRGDDDGDMVISDEECTEIIQSLEAMSGLDFNDQLLREKIVGKKVDSLIEVIGEMIRNDVGPEKLIFKIKEDE